MESDKKIIVFYVLNVLKEYSDENHLMNYSDIQEKIESIYKIKPEIKTIANNVNTLINAGYEIMKMGKSGCYLSCRTFESGELTYLVDAVNSSNAIPAKQAKELIDKLTSSVSKYEKSKYKTIQKVDTVAHSKNREMFYVIEILNEAIEKGKKVKFNYNEYMLSTEMTPRFQGKQYLISPYFLVNSRGKYYLVCNYDKYNDLSNYKIECISNITITDEPIKPISQLDNTEGFTKKKYIDEHIYMTFGKSIEAKLKVSKSKYINDLVDWFGDKIQVKVEDDNNIIVSLEVNEQALIYWALQYGEHFEVISPQDTREKIKQTLKNIMAKYE